MQIKINAYSLVSYYRCGMTSISLAWTNHNSFSSHNCSLGIWWIICKYLTLPSFDTKLANEYYSSLLYIQIHCLHIDHLGGFAYRTVLLQFSIYNLTPNNVPIAPFTSKWFIGNKNKWYVIIQILLDIKQIWNNLLCPFLFHIVLRELNNTRYAKSNMQMFFFF